MPYSFKVARSTHEKSRVYSLRHKVFVEEEKRFQYPKDKIKDSFDDLDSTFSILAECDELTAGTIRATLNGPDGLPPLEHYDFQPFMSKHDGIFAGISWLCISERFRIHRALLPGLFKMMVREVRKMGGQHLIAALHPGILPLLRAFGATQIGEVFHSQVLDVPMVPIHVDLDHLPNGVRENSQDPLNLVFDDSEERRIYTRGENLTEAGKSGNEAFLIMRGSVQVVLDSTREQDLHQQSPLLGPGQVFGELALLDGGPRTATVICHSREVDTMIYSHSEFLKQLHKDHAKTLKICRILGIRLRHMLQTDMSLKPQESLAARILFDASRQGTKPVAVKFLASQCGLWEKDLRKLLHKWQDQQIITFEADSLVSIANMSKFENIATD